MSDRFSRTELLLGQEGRKKLAASRVAVFGIGGVGGYAVEALARSGVGAIDLIDDDRICITNINRQILALSSTIGRYKVDVGEERILAINPDCIVTKHICFFLPENSADFDFSLYDYVVDAVDTVTAKLEIIKKAGDAGVPVISCMGAGNKMDASAFRVADIYDTKVCPLAKRMRKLCKDAGIKSLKVVYSEEEVMVPQDREEKYETPHDVLSKCPERRRIPPGSNAFVPGVAGLIAAGEVIKDLCGFSVDKR
jgi:tRNA A37 threonylcarbamoyladenosine dehydratase